MNRFAFCALVSEALAGVCLLGFIGLCMFPTPSTITNICICFVLGVVFIKQIIDMIKGLKMSREFEILKQLEKEAMKNGRRKDSDD